VPLTTVDCRWSIATSSPGSGHLSIDNRQSPIANYSYLNATMGSTLVARRAGM
jgi:hypothetical protein